MTAVSDAIAKMQTLSEERAARAVSLIEDLAEYQTTGEAIPSTIWKSGSVCELSRHRHARADDVFRTAAR